MGSYEEITPPKERKAMRDELLASDDYPFIQALPKVELHLHVEGTLLPELRWKFAERNNLTLKSPRTGQTYASLEHLKSEVETFTFFEAYYDGFNVLLTKQDYYDLAVNYFERAAAMNVR